MIGLTILTEARKSTEQALNVKLKDVLDRIDFLMTKDLTDSQMKRIKSDEELVRLVLAYQKITNDLIEVLETEKDNETRRKILAEKKQKFFEGMSEDYLNDFYNALDKH